MKLLSLIILCVLYAVPVQAQEPADDENNTPEAQETKELQKPAALPGANDTQSITILASSSLTNFIEHIIKDYATSSNTSVSASFEAPSELVNQIEVGEPADVIIIEDQQRMQQLKQQGLVDVYNLGNIASGNLVLVASPEHRAISKITPETSFEDSIKLLAKQSLFVIPDPEIDSAGATIRDMLTNLGVWKTVEPYLIRANNTRHALYLIAKGHSAGLLYAADVVHSPDVKIIRTLDADAHAPIVYQAAPVAGENMEKARQFVEYLRSPRVARALQAEQLQPSNEVAKSE